MKKIIFIVLTIVAFGNQVTGQIHEGWSVGLRGYGFHFWRYNPYEWKVISRDLFYPVETEASNLNGWSGGINLEWRKDYRWAFALGLEYSSQEQKYVSSSGTREDTAGVITILITDDISASFDYVKIPVSVIYNLPVEGSNLEFSIQAGVHLSYLQRYLTRYRSEKNHTLLINTFESNDYTFEFYDFMYPEYDRTYTLYDNWKYYRQFVLGTTLSAHVRYYIGERLSIDAGLRFEYDITSSDNLEYAGWFGSVTGGYGLNAYDRPVTHNIRLGLELGIQYYFDK